MSGLLMPKHATRLCKNSGCLLILRQIYSAVVRAIPETEIFPLESSMRLDMKTQTSGQITKAAIRAHHLRTARAEAGKNKVLQSNGALRCRRKFLRYFPNGFMDDNYLAWERDYKIAAHRSWNAMLNHQEFAGLLRANKFEEVAMRAVRIESRTNLIFSFEKM